jgi:osomolarity two-component system response regulator SKN7
MCSQANRHQAWEFKHPDFKMNNKDALDNIRRKAPAPRKPNQPNADDMLIPSQQMDMVSGQLMATQAQLHQVEGRYNELSIHHSMLLQEVIGLQKTVVNHEHVMQQIMTFLHGVDATQRRNSKLVFGSNGTQPQNGAVESSNPAPDDDDPASPLQHASKLLSETNADVMLNPRNLEHMNEITMRMNGTLTTPPPDFARAAAATRPTSRGPPSASSVGSMRLENLDNLVYPVGSSNGIDPMYSEHINNIPYAAPPKAVEAAEPKFQEGRKKSTIPDPGWIRPPQILLVEDDPTCRRIGSKFLYAFHCAIDSAVSIHPCVSRDPALTTFSLMVLKQ